MERKLLLLIIPVIFWASCIFAYNKEYVSAVHGDTLVVKDDVAYGAPDALYMLMTSDTVDVPAGRVYLLLNNGYYSLINIPTSSKTQKIVIMGESEENIKLNNRETAPPIVCGTSWEGGYSTGGLKSGYDLLVKNINANVGNAAGNMGWTFFGTDSGGKITIENCLLEHNQWVMINPATDSRVTFKDCYILNMVGYPNRLNGGVIDFYSDQDSILFENCTILQAQGSLFRFRHSYHINRATFNHNTFINCAGYTFLNVGNSNQITLTNNIFVNCNIQAHSSVYFNADWWYGDPEGLPMGLVNVFDDSSAQANGLNFYVDKNLVYWDPIFDDYIDSLNTNAVIGHTDWESEMITMNVRTQAMFDDDLTYPYLTEGTWFRDKMPNFTDPQDLFTTQLVNIKDYVLKCVDTSTTVSLPDWRLVNTPIQNYYTHSDWPIPVDLSYDDANLKTSAMGGFPLGDLNWFPIEKTTWEAQKEAEYAYIDLTLCCLPFAIKEQLSNKDGFELVQNYPNPFNPSTIISWRLAASSHVELSIYNILGQKVTTLINKKQSAGHHQIEWDASGLASGIYLYHLKVNDYEISKKMVLMK